LLDVRGVEIPFKSTEKCVAESNSVIEGWGGEQLEAIVQPVG